MPVVVVVVVVPASVPVVVAVAAFVALVGSVPAPGHSSWVTEMKQKN